MLLADNFVQSARTHALGQRRGCALRSLAVGQRRKKIHGRALRCRWASYSATDAATPALSDSTRVCGILTNSSMAESSSRGIPAPSLPTNEAQEHVRSESCNLRAFCGLLPSPSAICDERGAINAMAVISRDFSSAMSSSDGSFMTGSRNTEPAEARITFVFHWLTVPSMEITEPAPNASAERIIVPKFPGSWIPAATI